MKIKKVLLSVCAALCTLSVAGCGVFGAGSGGSDSGNASGGNESSVFDDASTDDSTDDGSADDSTGDDVGGSSGGVDVFGDETVATEGLVYEMSEDGESAAVVGYEGDSTKIVIASTYEGKPVTKIGTSAFQEQVELTSVVIPESVTVVEAAAFYGCSNLTNVKVGKGAKGYMDYAFGECNNLTNVYVTDIATWCLSERLGNFVAFGLKDKNLYCNDVLVTDLALPDDLVYVKDYAFAFGSITSVAIPDSTTSIAEGAFKGCNNLTNISVGENNAAYKDIAGNLYSKDGRTLLQYAVGNTATEFVISDSVQTIGGNAFNNAKSLTSVVIGTLVMKISRYAFNGCSNLKSVTFKNTVGWIYSSKNINVSSGTSGTSDFKELAEADIADAATAANYLTSKYIGYYWYR